MMDNSSLRGKAAQIPVIDNKNAVRGTVTWSTNRKTAALHVSSFSELLLTSSTHNYHYLKQFGWSCHMVTVCLFAGIWRSFAHNSVPSLFNTSVLNTARLPAFIGIFWISVAVAPLKNETALLITARIYTAPSMTNQTAFAQTETSKLSFCEWV